MSVNLLTKKEFEMGVRYLKAFYNNFQFDLDDNMKYEIWFTVFKEFDSLAYTNVLKLYTSASKYPPNSPHDILEPLNKLYRDRELDDEEAWALFRKIENGNGGLYYNKDKVFEELEKYPLIYKVAKEYEAQLVCRLENDVYLIKDFKKYYTELKMRYIHFEKRLYINKKTKELESANKDMVCIADDLCLRKKEREELE